MSDPGTDLARQQYDGICAARDEVKAMLASNVRALKARLSDGLRSAPRCERRRLQKIGAKIDRVSARIDRMIEKRFEDVTRGFNAETGTLAGVAEEAAAMLADALR